MSSEAIGSVTKGVVRYLCAVHYWCEVSVVSVLRHIQGMLFGIGRSRSEGSRVSRMVSTARWAKLHMCWVAESTERICIHNNRKVKANRVKSSWLGSHVPSDAMYLPACMIQQVRHGCTNAETHFPSHRTWYLTLTISSAGVVQAIVLACEFTYIIWTAFRPVSTARLMTWRSTTIERQYDRCLYLSTWNGITSQHMHRRNIGCRRETVP
jgi:hypothetical protein